MYKEFTQLNTRKTNNPLKKWAKDLNRHFSKEDIHMAHRHEKMLNIINYHRDAKTTMRYHFTPVRMAIINQQTSAGKDVGKREPYCTVGGNADRFSHCRKQYGISSKN